MKSCNKNVYRFSITSRCILKVNKAEKVWNNNKTVININFQIILFIMVSNALLPFSLSFNTSYCRRKKENLLICHFDFFCCRKSHNYTLFLIQRAHAHKKVTIQRMTVLLNTRQVAPTVFWLCFFHTCRLLCQTIRL